MDYLFSNGACIYNKGGYKSLKTKFLSNGERIRVFCADIPNGKEMKSGLLFGHMFDVMPDIIDIEMYGDGKAIKVKFADNTFETAVLDEEDRVCYDGVNPENCLSEEIILERGISICITKKLLSLKTGGKGSSVYNKVIKHGVKIYRRKQEQKAKELYEAVIKKKKHEKMLAKKNAWLERRKEKAREERIEIQKEAYLRAMKEYGASHD